MNEQTEKLLRRGVAALDWTEARLLELENGGRVSPVLVRMHRDCASLRVRLAEELIEFEELSELDDPQVEWHPKWPGILSGQDLAFLQTLQDYLAQDSKGGGGHFRALAELERFISEVDWV